MNTPKTIATIASASLSLIALCSGLQAKPNAEKSSHPAKKGICLTSKAENWKERVRALNPSWHYNWNFQMPNGKADLSPNIEYVPMIFTGRFDADKVQEKLTTIKDNGATCILGYNEPDGKDQGNTTIEQALAQWPLFKKSQLRVGSPATKRNNGGDEWFDAFMSKVQAADAPDFIAIHWYGDITDKSGKVTAKPLENSIRKFYQKYHKPIWVTEFAAADWSPTHDKITPEQALEFMKLALPMLDQLAAEGIVERYAWFTGLKPALDQSSLFVGETTELTPCGTFYKNYTPKAKP